MSKNDAFCIDIVKFSIFAVIKYLEINSKIPLICLKSYTKKLSQPRLTSWMSMRRVSLTLLCQDNS